MTEQNDIIEKLLQLRHEANQILTEALTLRDEAIAIKRSLYTAGMTTRAAEMKRDDEKT